MSEQLEGQVSIYEALGLPDLAAMQREINEITGVQCSPSISDSPEDEAMALLAEMLESPIEGHTILSAVQELHRQLSSS